MSATKLRDRMASQETPPLSLQHGVRCVPDDGVMVEDVLVAVGDEVGFESIIYASRMNKAVVVFVKEKNTACRLIENGIVIRDNLVQVTPLHAPSSKIIISNIPPFISNEALERELVRFGKFASEFRTISLGCKHPSLKHVQSFRRQVYMFLDSPENTLDVSFRVKHEGRSYMLYATTGNLRCFVCGDVGHKRIACPRKEYGGAKQTVSEGEVDAVIISVGDEIAGPSGLQSDTGTIARVISEPVYAVPIQSAECSASDVTRSGNAENPTAGTSVIVPGISNVEQSRPNYNGEESDEINPSGLLTCTGNDSIDAMSDDTDSIDIEGSQGDLQKEISLYPLEEINHFLDDTFGKQVNVRDFFPDIEKFVRSVTVFQKAVGFDILSEKKRFRLKKHLTAIRKCRKERKKSS